MHALVIDDSRAVRSILKGYLKGLQHEVVEAADGAEALRVLKSNPGIGFALVDWNMPNMNGLEFVTAARADRSFDGTRFIMVTTETEMDNVSKALQAGADEYIMKPFTQEMIEEKLRMVGL